MNQMTPRQRMLAVIRGEKHDRVPFVQYHGIAAPNDEVWDLIGRGNMGVLPWTAVHSVESPNCRFESEEFERNGRRGVRTVMRTSEGDLTEEKLFEPAFSSAAISKHFIQSPEDYRPFVAYLRDVIVHGNVAAFTQVRDWLGDDGIPLTAVPRTPYQQLWVQWVSLEDLSLHFVDCPDVLDEVISLMMDIQRRIHRIVRDALDEVAIPMVGIPDNITAPAIGPRYFEKYCVPLYNELAGMLAEKNVPVFVHVDGDLRPLWDQIGASRIGGLDSMSPPPDNDTSVAAALSMWPDKRLWINFPSSVHLAEPDVIYEKTIQLLTEAKGTGRLQIQISENVPPGVWRKSFPAIVKAIEDFGPPT